MAHSSADETNIKYFTKHFAFLARESFPIDYWAELSSSERFQHESRQEMRVIHIEGHHVGPHKKKSSTFRDFFYFFFLSWKEEEEEENERDLKSKS